MNCHPVNVRSLALALAFGAALPLAAHAGGIPLRVVHDFDNATGWEPVGLAAAPDGSVYGTTTYGGPAFSGTLFRVRGSDYKVMHEFDFRNAGLPINAPTVAPDGTVYGFSADGGTYEHGVAWQWHGAGTFTHVASLQREQSTHGHFALGSDGRLYGIGTGYNGNEDIYAIDPSTREVTSLHLLELADTVGAPLAVDGSTLRGTYEEDRSGSGAVFTLQADGSDYVQPPLPAAMRGLYTSGQVRGADGAWYGYYDGKYGHARLYRQAADGTMTTVHDFGPQSLAGDPLVAQDGRIYVACRYCGADGNGRLFVVDPTTGAADTLHTFTGTEGKLPVGSLVQANDGTIYGLTALGGVNGLGTVFSFRP